MPSKNRFLNLHGYMVVRILSDDIVVLESSYGRQIFIKSSQAGREAHDCAICMRDVPSNTERMYRLLGHQDNRWHRICCNCIEEEDEE